MDIETFCGRFYDAQIECGNTYTLTKMFSYTDTPCLFLPSKQDNFQTIYIYILFIIYHEHEIDESEAESVT